MKDTSPRTILLKDYKKPDYLISETHLDFIINDESTTVHSILKVKANYDFSSGVRPLELTGEKMKLISVSLDGNSLSEEDYELTEESLTINNPTAEFVLEVTN